MTGYPAARRCHSCVQVKDGKDSFTHFNVCTPICCLKCFTSPSVSTPEVFICGGYNGELIMPDLWKINLRTFQWTKLPAVMPEPAYFHCAAVTPVSKNIKVRPISNLLRFMFCRS